MERGGVTEVGVEPDANQGVCSKVDCPVSAGGQCAEGHEDPLDCEFYDLSDVVVDELEPPDPRRISLPSGEALHGSELERVLASHPASIVVPLGFVGAGKTTLISLTYHLLRSRRLVDFRFAGSKTVIGFARRSHHASFSSNRAIPTTARTEVEASGLYLHLGIRREYDSLLMPMLIVDLSGEHVRALADGKVESAVLNALARADHIPIVVNGAEIATPDTRARAVLGARTLLGMLEKQPRAAGAKICVVITKGDLLLGVEMEEVFDAITRDTIAAGAPRFVTADRESASTDGEEPAVSLGDGVAELVAHMATRQIQVHQVARRTTRPTEPSKMLRRLWTSK
ncbi:MAG: TRAFAC clade GTPase domain-containing protein [Gaiellaceae bacterium]